METLTKDDRSDQYKFDEKNHHVLPLRELCKQARTLWLSSAPDSFMTTVEQLYRSAWERIDTPTCGTEERRSIHVTGSNESKKQKLDSSETVEVDKKTSSATDWKRHAGEKLALILLQSGRTMEADKILITLGYPCRFAELILNYAEEKTVPSSTAGSPTASAVDPPCHVFDNYLHDNELRMLHSVFVDPKSSYWTEHNYTVEPPSPYFSYILPLKSDSLNGQNEGIHAMVRRLQDFLKPYFSVQNATFCEMWAHNRPHATGHQFHFDSDNEGCTEVIRNPICSCIVYLSGNGIGGPSVVTNQRLSSQNLACISGWMCQSRAGRMMAFEGKVLHGVIPGKAGIQSNTIHTTPESRRVSVMFAFWKKIRIRDNEPGHGAARLFPSTQPEWVHELQKPLLNGDTRSSAPPTTFAQPTFLPHVYETTSGGKPWTRMLGLPNYEDIFQGF